jgi:hypothetical protein
MKNVAIGDQVVYQPWGNQPSRTATVEGIEICREGYKSGKTVEQCDLDKCDEGVIDLSDNHWIYFYQVKRVIKKQ